MVMEFGNNVINYSVVDVTLGHSFKGGNGLEESHILITVDFSGKFSIRRALQWQDRAWASTTLIS